MWIVLTRECVTAGVSGRINKGTEKRLEMMWCQHGCHSCKEQEVYNAVRTTHCATETIDNNSSILSCRGPSVSSQRSLPNSSISCSILLEESVSHFQLSTDIYLVSLILICPLIRLIQLQSLRFEFSIGFMEFLMLMSGSASDGL